MANRIYTTFQKLSKVFDGSWVTSNGIADMTPDLPKQEVIYSTDDPTKYQEKKLELQQDRYLHNRWVRANENLSMSAFANLSNIKLMYRDADLMDSYPEIGSALDLCSEESVQPNPENGGQIVNVSSKSERIKSILEDLFVNRLNIQITGQMIIRAMCKYGNQFMLLDIDKELGVKGWRQLPVGEVERVENGIVNPYGGAQSIAANTGMKDKDTSTKFYWTSETGGDMVPFRNWQIAHFRLLHNSIFLPYGVSMLNDARRHFRMLALMEDSMLIYRLERSFERRVFKIYVGSLDDDDIQPYIEEIANQFKRTPIVDPMTGQLDLRKNILAGTEDYFIPVRSEDSPNPIETLSGAKNLDAIDDIKYVQKKVCAGLRIPLPFMNFDESVGDGKNLALMDVRFARTINRYQQAFLMELTKVATIHLYLLGFDDDLTNFNLSMNNPSIQAEELALENLQKKISIFRDAVSDPGNGIPALSVQSAWKRIMKFSDKEIKEMLEEIRLEKALSAEYEKTSQIIKRSGIFDTVDRMYGEPGAEYLENAGGDMGPDGGGAPGGGGGFGGGLDDIGAPGNEDMGDISGEEGSEPVEDMGTGGEMPEQGVPENAQPMESRNRSGRILTEQKLTKQDKLTNRLFNQIVEKMENRKKEETGVPRVDIYDKNLMINEEVNAVIHKLDDLLNDSLDEILDERQLNNKGDS